MHDQQYNLVGVGLCMHMDHKEFRIVPCNVRLGRLSEAIGTDFQGILCPQNCSQVLITDFFKCMIRI